MSEADLLALIREARTNRNKAERRFMKDDNHEDMREMEQWAATVEWLESKLK